MSDLNNTQGTERRSNRRPRQNTQKRVNHNTGPFTNEEKELVLSALYTYGTNVDKIAPLIPTRSREQVRDFLTAWYRRVKKVPVVISERDHQTTLVKAPIEMWLDKIKKIVDGYVAGNSGALPSPWYPYALGFIAKYEKHPHPSETGGVDFRKLYEFLETALVGNVPKDLSFSDALYILSSLRKLKLKLEKVNFHKDETHLKRSMVSCSKPKTYKRVKKEDPNSEQTKTDKLEDFFLSKMMNPLQLPMEILSVNERLKTQPEDL